MTTLIEFHLYHNNRNLRLALCHWHLPLYDADPFGNASESGDADIEGRIGLSMLEVLIYWHHARSTN